MNPALIIELAKLARTLIGLVPTVTQTIADEQLFVGALLKAAKGEKLTKDETAAIRAMNDKINAEFQSLPLEGEV